MLLWSEKKWPLLLVEPYIYIHAQSVELRVDFAGPAAEHRIQVLKGNFLPS